MKAISQETSEGSLPGPTESRDGPSSIARPGLVAIAYFGMIVVAIAIFILIRHVGEGLTAPEAPDADVIAAAAPLPARMFQVNVVAHVLATLSAVIALGFMLGLALRYFGQPPVIGEVVAGILLGPSALGALSPDAMHAFIPGPEHDPNRQVLSALQAIAQLGIVLYMFLVGLDLNSARLKKNVHATVAISHASIIAPFLLGATLALWLYPIVSHRGVSFTSFTLFMGAALSVTAFPVLARILKDQGLDRTDIGVVALGCAAADDVTAWCLLALVLGVAKADVGSAFLVTVGALLFILLMFLVVRPLANWFCRKLDAAPSLPVVAVPAVFISILLSALATESIGIHAVFGAFLLGAVVPHDSRLAREFSGRLKDLVTVLLLPAFFALTGLKTEIGLLRGWENWLICGAIVAAATLGKFGGTFTAAQMTGRDWRSSAALGTMMNTRGLMGLVVVDIGLNLGVISSTLFAMMVVMALVTTMITSPILRKLVPVATENSTPISST